MNHVVELTNTLSDAGQNGIGELLALSFNDIQHLFQVRQSFFMLAGSLKELGESAAEAESVISGTIALGADAVTVLNETLDTLGVAK